MTPETQDTASEPTLIERLKAGDQPVLADDAIAEAGRKVLLRQFTTMLKHEAGSRTGADIEDVHDMRVATRRMRSTMRLIEPYFKPKRIRAYNAMLRRIAAALGAVRDLDVLIEDLTRYMSDGQHENAAALAEVVALLDSRRTPARAALNLLFDKGQYRRFTEDFAAFLLTPGLGVAKADDEPMPTTVRQLLPTIIYSHLGHVRAYDAILAEADDTTLHDLRIQFKRLRYAASLFSEVLGSSIDEYITQIRKAQDHLGRMNDIVTARGLLSALLPDLSPEAAEALNGYLSTLDAEGEMLRGGVAELWRQFNLKTVQRQLANAIAAL
jgi:CHAD domain-containing protein